MNIKLQALLLAAAVCAAPASASVRVYGEASSTGPEIKVEVYADIADTAIVSHTFRLYYNAGQLQLLDAAHNSAVWFLRNGNTTFPYPEPDGSRPGEILFMGAHMDGSNPHAGVSGNRVRLGRFGEAYGLNTSC